MPKKKPDELTPRQRQSRRIIREKAVRKKREIWRKRIYIGLAGFAAAVVIGGGLWLSFSNAGAKLIAATSARFYASTAKAGFRVQDIYLEGRNRTAMAEIEKALGVDHGQPIFKVDLDETRARLEKIESVRLAAVERALPGTLYVRIVEREPVALWQRGGKMALVDDNGAVMTGIDIAPYQNLPLIIGDDAPKHIEEVLQLLAAEPELAGRFAAAIRAGERRWNIRLENGVEIKLPEADAVGAWKRLAALQAEQKLLDRAVKTVDLRLEGRLFITVSPQDLPGKRAAAKET